MTNKTKFAASETVCCVLPYCTDRETYTLGLELRGDHPAVTAHPEMWRTKSTPRSEWPSPLDSVIEAGDQADAEAARANRVKLAAPAPPPMMKAVAEIVTTRDGKPTTIVKGSQVPPDDPLVAEHPGCWQPAA